MSRTAQATGGRIELLDATFEAHASARIVYFKTMLLDVDIFALAIGEAGMAAGHACRWHGCRFLAVGTVSRAASVARTAGTLLAAAVTGRAALPAAGRASACCMLAACPRGPFRAARCDRGHSGPRRPHTLNED